jgi:PKD repeat protein
MKIKILIVLFTICKIVNGQNPTADFRCYFHSFDTSSFECCIYFEDFAHDNDGSVISQLWEFGDSTSGSLNYSTGHFPAHCYSSIGSYTITFNVIDNDGHVDTLRALNCIVVDSTGCSCNWTTDIHENYGEEALFQIYPNPTSNTFVLKNIHSKGKTLLQIVNLFGEIIYTNDIFGKIDYVVKSPTEKGIYIVRLFDGERNIARKLIVE